MAAAAIGNFGWFGGVPIFFGGALVFSWRRRMDSAAEGYNLHDLKWRNPPDLNLGCWGTCPAQ